METSAPCNGPQNVFTILSQNQGTVELHPHGLCLIESSHSLLTNPHALQNRGDYLDLLLHGVPGCASLNLRTRDLCPAVRRTVDTGSVFRKHRSIIRTNNIHSGQAKQIILMRLAN